MVPKVKAWVSCLWNDHKWDRTRGFENFPKDGAVCQRCGKEYWRDDKDYL